MASAKSAKSANDARDAVKGVMDAKVKPRFVSEAPILCRLSRFMNRLIGNIPLALNAGNEPPQRRSGISWQDSVLKQRELLAATRLCGAMREGAPHNSINVIEYVA